MFSKLFRPRQDIAETAPHFFLEGRVGYAIGDIHGRADLLTRLMDSLEARAEAETRAGEAPIVVFLGDYIDRGGYSREVIEMLLSGRPHGFQRHFLKGNHEQALLEFLDDPAAGRDWVAHGGLETLVSYGVSPLPTLGASEEVWAEASAQLNVALPDAHRAFFNALERYLVLGDYAFVHAGLNPARSLEEQEDRDIFWIRNRFLQDSTPLPHRVVHGHTPSDRPYVDHRRIGIDTGAYISGRLTAVRLEGDDVSFVEA